MKQFYWYACISVLHTQVYTAGDVRIYVINNYFTILFTVAKKFSKLNIKNEISYIYNTENVDAYKCIVFLFIKTIIKKFKWI